MSFDGTNLTGTKWQFGETSLHDYQDTEFGFSVDFKSNGVLYGIVSINTNPELYYGGTVVYNGTWADDAYRTIEIVGGYAIEEQTLIDWLNTYAEFLGYANVTIEYGGNLISGMFESGAKAIRTLGKFCTDDFIIRYTAPSGDDLELIATPYEATYAFTDTNYPSWAYSTSAYNLLNSATIWTHDFTEAEISVYDYFIRLSTEVKVAYPDDGPQPGKYLGYVDERLWLICGKPSTDTQWTARTKNAMRDIMTLPSGCLSYYWDSSTATEATATSYTTTGIYLSSVQAPSKSSRTVTVTRAALTAKCATSSSSIFRNTQAALVDQENSYVKFKLRIYRTKSPNKLGNCVERLYDLWDNGL